MSSSPLRFGVLSTALIGREHVLPAIARASNAVLTAVGSRSHKKARALADALGAEHAFGDYDALLDSDACDAVYIPLPTSQHVEWAGRAIAAGKHVLVEKPLALNAKRIAPLIKARDAHGVIVSEAFMVTYHPQWARVQQLLAKGAIGSLRMVDAAFTYYNTDPKNMRNVPALGGGAIPDIGVYPIVTTRYATGLEPLRVQASIEFDPTFGTDRHASVRADFGDFEMMFYLSTQLAARQSIAFHGDKGFIELSAPFNSNLYEGDELRVHDREHASMRTHRYTGIDQYTLQIEAFARAVLDGKAKDVQRLFSLEDSVKNQRVLDAIYKAGKSGRWVNV